MGEWRGIPASTFDFALRTHRTLLRLRMMRLVVLCIALAHGGMTRAQSVSRSSPNRGHMQPFGNHRPPEGEIQSVDGNTVTPEEFWEFHRRQEAVVLRNVTTSWPARDRWDDNRLKERGAWGDFLVRTEGKVEGTMIPLSMSLEKFFREEQDRRYVVGELPSPMYEDVIVPGCFTCGPFSGHITEVDVWISNGATRSKFHKDSNNQLNCLIKGRKLWTVIDPTHIRKIPMMWEDDDPAFKTAGESLLNPMAIDLQQYPEVAQVPYNRSWLEPGDCIWMPGSTLHQVHSTADKTGRNLQVSLLFSEGVSVRKGIDPHYEAPPPFDPNDSTPCSTGFGPKKLSEFYVAWPYPGKGGTTYGFDCPKKFRKRLVAIMEHNRGSAPWNKKEFAELYNFMLMSDFPRKPSNKLFVFEGHQKYIPDALNIIRRRENYNLGDPEEWEKKAIRKKGRIYYPGLREAAVNLALKALAEWWDASPLTKDGSISRVELDSVSTKEFQESWAFLYFPVQSIGHAFLGAMERDDVRYEEMIEQQQERQEEQQRLMHDQNVGQTCSEHSHCASGYFCNGERMCEHNEGCHFDHDAVDKKCPNGPSMMRATRDEV